MNAPQIEHQGPFRVCQHCGTEYIQNHACGPVVVRETYGCDPDGKTYYVAVHESTGFCFTGRASRGEASADARIANAIVRYVIEDGNDIDGCKQRSLAWSAVCSVLNRVLPSWHKIADTGERSAVHAIERLAAEAARAAKEGGAS